MNFTEKDLILAYKKGILTSRTFNNLLIFLKELKNEQMANTIKPVVNTKNKEPEVDVIIPSKSKVTGETFFSYLGAFIVVAALYFHLGTMFFVKSYVAMFVFSLIYFFAFLLMGNYLRNNGKIVSGGVLHACLVFTVSVVMISFGKMTGIEVSSILVEIATILTGCLLLKYRNYSLILLPTIIAIFSLLLDVILKVAGLQYPNLTVVNVSLFIFSILSFISAVLYDYFKQNNHAAWLYGAGAACFWLCILLTIINLKMFNHFALFLFAVFCFLYMLIGVQIKQKTFIYFGIIGFFGYLSYLVFSIFKGSFFFIVLLVVAGLFVVFIGSKLSKGK